MAHSPVLQTRRRSLPARMNQQLKSSGHETMATTTPEPSTTAPYVYIDHAKTITLTELANKRQQVRRVEV